MYLKKEKINENGDKIFKLPKCGKNVRNSMTH